MHLVCVRIGCTGRNCVSTAKSSTDALKLSTCVPRNANTIASGIDMMYACVLCTPWK